MFTDYIFRGQSQTNEHLAVQGGLDWSSEKGFYAGAWGSNVDLGSDAQAELDYYFGYAGSLTETVDYDAGYIYYSYAGESKLDYQELALSVSSSGLALGVNYSNEYLGDGGSSYYYLSAEYSLLLPKELNLDIHIGFNHANNMDITFDGSGDDSYLDWSLGLTRPFNRLDIGIVYYGTDIGADNGLADNRLVFSISRAL